MAIFTVEDVHLIMNDLVQQATGQKSISVVDTSSFVTAGNILLESGTENTLNALSVIIGRTFMAVRPYEAKLNIINAINSGVFSERFRKISFYAKDSQASGNFNTQITTNHKQGFTNGQNKNAENVAQSTKSMWEQNQAMPLEVNFHGRKTWQDSTTIYADQLQRAFTNESTFADFLEGVLMEKSNDIESQKEAFNRAILLNRIAGQTLVNVPSSNINLTAEYNSKYGTTYTSEELRTTHLESFLKFFITTFKTLSDRMTNRSSMYHVSMSKNVDGVTYSVLRHTPKNRQRLLLYNPLFIEVEATVFPTIFNDRYLKLEQYEGVDYWQDIETPETINVTPTYLNADGKSVKSETAVELPYVVGMLYDVDGLMVDYQLETARATPIEARKGYHNIWWTFARNGINDFTENAIVFYMKDEPSGANLMDEVAE